MVLCHTDYNCYKLHAKAFSLHFKFLVMKILSDEGNASLVDHFCGEKNLIFDLAFDYTYFSRVRNVVAFSFFLLLLLF